VEEPRSGVAEQPDVRHYDRTWCTFAPAVGVVGRNAMN